MLPIFLFGSVLCTCLGNAAAADTSSRAHACCPDGEHPAPTPAHDQHSDCQHCNHAQSLETAAVKAPQPTIATTPWVAHPLVLVRLAIEVASPPPDLPRSVEKLAYRRSILRDKCVLLI